jgi:uncharacterized protein (TIRG00374 family)
MPNKAKMPLKLSGLRVWTPFFLGIGVAAYLLYTNLSELRFVEVQNNEIGTHAWQDSNDNGEIDHWLEEEFVLAENGNFRKQNISDILFQIQWSRNTIWFILLAIAMMVVRDLGYIIRIRLLTDKFLTWKRSLITIMMWEFASAVSPGVVGGAAFAMFILNREKIPMGRATAIVVSTAFLDNLFFVIAIPLVVSFVGLSVMLDDFSTDVSGSFMGVFWTGYVIILGFTMLLFVSLFFYPKLIKSIMMFFAKWPIIRRYKDKLEQVGDDIVLTSKEFSSRSLLFWLKVFGATLLSWTGRYLVINMILAAFLSLGFYDHLVVLAKQFVLWVMMLISPTPGASGVAEWAFAKILGTFASSALLISSLAILWRLISYFPYLFIGSLLLPRWLGKRKP